MPPKSPKRLPKKFARKASADTKRYVKRTMRGKRRHSREKFRRLSRRAGLAMEGFRADALRWILILGFLGFLGFFGFLLFSPAIEVREIEVTRLSPRLDIEDVQQALAPMFGRHLFFLSSFEVTALVRDALPDVRTIVIQKVYPSTLGVSIELEPLVAKLVIAEPDQQNAVSTGATVDFLTENGIYIATTAAQEPETLPEITIVDWGVRPDPGSRLIDPKFLERVNAAELTLLRQFGQEVEKRTIFLRAQEFHLKTGGKELWFDIRSPIKDHIERYRLFLRSVPAGDAAQYIDLRVANRIIYR